MPARGTLGMPDREQCLFPADARRDDAEAMDVRFRPPAPAGPPGGAGTWFDDHGWSAQGTAAAR